MPPYQALDANTEDFSFLETGKGKGKEEAEHGDGDGDGPRFTVDDFAPLRMVGNGDMGTVYLVTRVDTKEPFAMKVMRKEVLKARDTFFRADMERDILASLNHPFLPTLYADFETERHRLLVMDYACGGDLNGLRHRQGDKLFSPAAARFYASEVVLALEYLHSKGVIYRDLKPENILIKEDGHIMLADFDLSAREVGDKYVTKAVVVDEEPVRPKRKRRGLRAMFACAAPAPRSGGKHAGNGIARVTPLEVLTERQKVQKETGRTHSFVGTEEYVAPEVVWGTGHGKAVDWWTLGILIYEMVCGKTPFKGENRKGTFVNIICKDVVMPGPPGPVKDLVERLLIRDPTRRLGSAAGADEIKSHPFFSGVDWEGLELLARPPYVPAPFSLEEEEAERKKRAATEVEAAVGSRDVESGSGSGAVASPSRVLEDMHLAVLEHGGSVRVADGVELETESSSSSGQGSRFFELSGGALGFGGEEEEEEDPMNVFEDTF